MGEKKPKERKKWAVMMENAENGKREYSFGAYCCTCMGGKNRGQVNRERSMNTKGVGGWHG